jgi:phosphoglycolate phosphatase-like HAD superfamily hydrolase
MSNLNNPAILALDFDGVICDGLIEYFQTAKLAYLEIWKPENNIKIDDLATSFYKLRPVIEVGWEMPILLRALVLKISEREILQNWMSIAQKIIQSEQINTKEIGKKLDSVRDRWIESNLEEWLELHRFYPGIIDRLKQIINSTTQLYIVSTKEGRFIDRLLRQNGIVLPASSIIGKECKQPKYETLRQIINGRDDLGVWFVEDRLKTLETLQQQPDLQNVKLFLADWGYNLDREREAASKNSNIQLLSLTQFAQDFSRW